MSTTAKSPKAAAEKSAAAAKKAAARAATAHPKYEDMIAVSSRFRWCTTWLILSCTLCPNFTHPNHLHRLQTAPAVDGPHSLDQQQAIEKVGDAKTGASRPHIKK